MVIKTNPDYLAHHGILGQKWGDRNGPPYPLGSGDHSASEKKAGWRSSLQGGGSHLAYKSNSLSSYISRKQNEKVDKSFDEWKEGAANKEKAISSGKEANKLRIVYEKNKSDKEAKAAYKLAEKQYKKDLRDNTHYRQGQIRKEVGQDMSRKYLSEARKIEKQLEKDPNNKELFKEYSRLMNAHDVERAKARRAEEVGAARSQKQANIKRTMTIATKAIVTTAALTAGLYAVNSILENGDVRLDGIPVRINAANVVNAKNAINLGKEFVRFLW